MMNTGTRDREWTFEELGIENFESPKNDRGNYPRFSIKVDGKTHCIESKKSLCGLLSKIRSSNAPDVFRNLGKGVTIDFDND